MTTPAEIAESLTLEDIPIKLRCATCNRVAQDAVRLPCCDQNICDDCQQTKLDAVCPICYHEPLDAAGCTPNKALRQTIRVFLKRKAIDRDNAMKQAAKRGNQAAAATAIEESSEPKTAHQSEKVNVEWNLNSTPSSASMNVSGDLAGQRSELPHVQEIPLQDVPQPSIESPEKQSPPRRRSTTTVENDGKTENVDTFDGSTEQNKSSPKQQEAGDMLSNGGSGMMFDPSMMANMATNGMGDMNQMMQLLQSNAANPMMNGYNNMIGMPGMGMGMDPMTMQAMFNNIGGPGMMNGMSMGMGFDAGQGAFGGGFNGQPQAMWNSGGQNNFGQGEFGGYGAGYNMPQHQGNFNQMHQPNYNQNDFHHHGYHNQGFHRGRGRGRGSYPYSARGRGNFHQVNQNYHANSVSTSQEAPEGPVRRGSPEYTPMNAGDAESAPIKEKAQSSLRDEFAPGDADDQLEEDSRPVPDAVEAKDVKSRSVSPAEVSHRPQVEPRVESLYEDPTSTKDTLTSHGNTSLSQDLGASIDGATLEPVPATISSAMPPPASPSIPTGPSKKHSLNWASNSAPQDSNKGLHARGFTKIPSAENAAASARSSAEKPTIMPSEPKGMGVTGAPTGPKAMRQPLIVPTQPDTGFSIVGRAAAARARADDRSKSPHRSPSASRSPSRHRPSRNHHRERSSSPRYDQPEERRKGRHRRHRSRHNEEGEEELAYQKPKSSHRSHRDKDHKSERDRDVERSSRRSYKDHDRDDAEHEHHKHRYRSPSASNDIRMNGTSKVQRSQHRRYEKEDEYTAPSLSNKRRSRDEYEEDGFEDGDRHRSHRHSKRSRHAPSAESRDAYLDERNGHNKPHSSQRLSERADPPVHSSNIPSGPRASTSTKPDLHSMEREKRDRERQMKELQRRALAGNPGSGSSRRASENEPRRPSDGGVGGHDDGGGIRINGAASRRDGGGRKISVKYEDELDDLRR